MTTAFLTHPDALTHVNPEGHPECVARLEAIYAATDDLDLLRLEALWPAMHPSCAPIHKAILMGLRPKPLPLATWR